MKDFRLDEYINDINAVYETEEFIKRTEIFLIKLDKKVSEIYKQDSGDDSKKLLLDALIEKLNESRFKKREVVYYDAVTNKKNTHELVKVDDYPNINEKLKEFNNSLSSTKGLKEDKFRLYAMTLKTNKHNYKIIGSFANTFALKKKFLIGNFSDSKIKLNQRNDIIGFNKKIELFVIDDKYILINQAESKFESLFKMNILFSNQATQILRENDRIKEIFDIKTCDKLSKKVELGKRMATRLIKIVSDTDRFNKTIDNIDKIKDIIDNNNHKFHEKVKDVNYRNGKLSVPDGKEVQLLDAISDAFYQAVISETENVDETRM